jgi:nuclear transport factor 2 (NTF2) superfamily protein
MASKGEEKKTAAKPRTRSGQLKARAAKKFLTQYKEAWEARDADLAATLFTRDAHYWENPFGEAIVGREAIRAYWQAATDTQEDIHFKVGNAFHHKYTLVAEWTCDYRHRPSGELRELAGIMSADFYGVQVRTFREYWHRRTK